MKRALIISVIVITVFICGALLFFSIKNRNSESVEETTVISAEEQEFIDDNPGLYAEQTGSDADVNNEDESPSQLFIMNSEFFDSTNLPFYALSTFQPSAEEYFTQNTDISTWHIYLSDYEDNGTILTFVIRMDEISTKSYKCTWDTMLNLYSFEENK